MTEQGWRRATTWNAVAKLVKKLRHVHGMQAVLESAPCVPSLIAGQRAKSLGNLNVAPTARWISPKFGAALIEQFHLQTAPRRSLRHRFAQREIAVDRYLNRLLNAAW
jgi:hypothetical protein